MKKKTLEQWMKDGSYLPKFLRDFHAQKDIFKWLWRKTDADKNDTFNGMNWISAHIFAIDYFLWFMAKHGYTLQPVRKDFEFRDWTTTIDSLKQEEAEAFRKMMEERKP